MYHKAKLENFLTSIVIITQNYDFYIISVFSGFDNPLVLTKEAGFMVLIFRNTSKMKSAHIVNEKGAKGEQ